MIFLNVSPDLTVGAIATLVRAWTNDNPLHKGPQPLSKNGRLE